MRSPVQLSPEQAEVVYSNENCLSVVASAGSGKTLVLVQRYLRHVLEEGVHPDRILTITFTRKAAAEMKARIVSGLRQAGAWEQAQIAETGPIQTIHSLCEQLLRERAFEARLDVKFEILSDSQSSRLQFEAIEEALAIADPSMSEAEDLVAKLAGKRSFGNPNSPYSRLRYSIQETLKQLRDAFSGDSMPTSTYLSAKSFQSQWTEALIQAQPQEIQNLLHEGSSLDWRENLQRAWKSSRSPTPNWLRHLPDPEDDRRCETETCGVTQFALEAWSLLQSRMEKLQQFDFSYLEDRTLRMLRQAKGLPSTISGRFEVLMIDEAQDLNPKQHELIAILGQNRRLTVGDDRQSIYGFRLADPELFRTAHKIGAKRLSRNFRSEPGILSFIDTVFADIWKQEYDRTQTSEPFDLDQIASEDFTGVEMWEMGREGPPSCGLYVRQLIDEGNQAGDICILTRNGAACQRIHEALSELGIASRIQGGAEKFYTRMEVRDLANTLRCLADPYNDFSLLATLRGPAVELSIESIVKLARNRPVIDALTEVDLGFGENEKIAEFRQWYDPIRSYADRVSAWEILSRILADTPFLAALTRRGNGARQIANVRKLLVLATRDADLSPLEFADQIRDIQELRHKEGDADEFSDASNAVRLMTIHKAKGLEFPIVILPETNQKLGGRSQEIIYDPELRMIASHFGGSQGLFYKFLAHRKKERDIAEELRVLYVAMTRAQKKLCIGLYPPSSGDTVSRRIRSLVGNLASDSIRARKPDQNS
jgi:ATP-dependent exoDNAse (exonuclease V) beta subunit